MLFPWMAWYLPQVPLPDTPLVCDLAIGAWFGWALLASLAGLLWSAAGSPRLRTRLPRQTSRPRPRLIGGRHAVSGRP
jgi:hypothetical protein